MGEFNTVGLEDIIDAFSRREAATVEAVPKMLKAGADVLIEAQRAEAQAMGLNETGGFINSIKATDVKGDDTEKYVEIYPQGRAKHGNDRKGDKSKVRYATIGFVAEYHASVAWGWDKKSPLNTGEKSYDVGNIYQYYAYSLAALGAGGRWNDGANCGARAVICYAYPWIVYSSIGARGACDSL